MLELLLDLVAYAVRNEGFEGIKGWEYVRFYHLAASLEEGSPEREKILECLERNRVVCKPLNYIEECDLVLSVRDYTHDIINEECINIEISQL